MFILQKCDPVRQEQTILASLNAAKGTCRFKSCLTIQTMIYFREWPFSKNKALICLENIPKPLEILKFYPYEVIIMVLHSKKGIPKLHCSSR